MQLKINRNHLFYIVGVSLLCIYAVTLLLGSQVLQMNTVVKQTAVVALIEVVFCLFVWKKQTGTLFSLFVFYFLSFYIFTMGQSLLYVLDIEHSFSDVYSMVSKATLAKAHVFTILCMAFLFEGALFATTKKGKRKSQSIGYYPAVFREVGLLLFIVSVVPMAVYLVNLAIAFRIGGYAYAFSEVANTSGWMRIVTKVYPFFVPSLVMLIIGHTGIMRRIAQWIMGVVGVVYFFIGERTGAASVLLALFILDYYLKEYKSEKKKTKKANKIWIAILVAIFIIFIPAIGALRNTTTLSVEVLVEAVKEEGIMAGIVDTFATMGYSEYPLAKVIDIVPANKAFAYGQSYFYAFLSLIPNIFGGVHVSVQYASLAQWLMDYLNLSYGPGFSYPAEAWYNFGWYGCIVMSAIGYVFAWFMNISKKEKISNVTLFISIVFFIETVTSPRRDLMTVVRLVGYYVFIPVLIMYLFNLRYKKSK